MTKMVPLAKQSKASQREYYRTRRGSWNGVSPVTRIAKNKRQFDRIQVKRETLSEIFD